MMTKYDKEQIAKWKANRKKWIAALRSSKYQQGDGLLLSHDNMYCCLGVLCDVIGMRAKRHKTHSTIYFGTEYQFAPRTAMRAVGMCDDIGNFFDESDKDNILSDSLVNMNDDHKSFDEIADIIEREPIGLFKENSCEEIY